MNRSAAAGTFLGEVFPHLQIVAAEPIVAFSSASSRQTHVEGDGNSVLLAMSAKQLPLDSAVEIEAVFEIS